MVHLGKELCHVPSEKTTDIETYVATLSEFDEYVGLCEVMSEDKLKKLVRKIE
jgi:hypothetical protein